MGSPLTTLYGDRISGEGAERAVNEAALLFGWSGCPEQGLSAPTSWTCIFLQVGTLASQPHLGADGTL